MKGSFTGLAFSVLLVAVLSACGGGSDGGGAPPAPPPVSGTPLGQNISAAALDPANDSSVNSSSAFKVLQDNGVAAVTVASAPVVNFTVFSDRTVKQGLTLGSVRFALAKLVPGTNGEIDRWVSYVSRTETATAGVGPGGMPVLASAVQATTDPQPSSQASQLVYNGDGYYTYTFSTNITDPTQTNGVVFEPGRTHRVAIQLSYTNGAGETVLVNPYFDFTLDASGKSVAITDPSRTRVMADVSSCNGCHEKLALHGGGRVDTQYCVMCHNPGTTDANSGNVLTMQTMTHKLHAGRLLKRELDANRGGEDYVIWGFRDSKHDYAEVGFPQDLRNCSVCHSGSNPKTPQGDNWKSRASKESCLTCHANNAGSTFVATHTDFALSILGAGGQPKDIPNASCVECHQPGRAVSPERVHFNQNEEHAAKYEVNIESATFDAAGRKVTVRYSVTDPTNANARYNLVTPDCTAPAPAVCAVPENPGNPRSAFSTRFGNLRFYLAYQNLVGQPTQVTEFTAYNNGGSAANAYLYLGTNDGSNIYSIDIPLPADSATAVALGTARVVGIGQVKEPLLEVKSAADPRPEVSPRQLVSVVVQHTSADVVLSGAANPRRQIVSNEKCNVCHGALGTTSGSNTLAEAFHGGARNTVEACALCHDANRFSSTVMTNGLALSENYSFKRMIHGIHGNSKRIYPFTHGNSVIGAFSKAGILLTDGLISVTAANAPLGTPFLPFASSTAVAAGTSFAAGVENYAAEVAYPGVGLNCNACHVNDSWKRDPGTVGAVVSKPLVGTATPLSTDPDPLNWRVISPRAATCTACHDSKEAGKGIDHVVSFGGSSFGTLTQVQHFLAPRETCDDCHAIGTRLGVDIVHGLK